MLIRTHWKFARRPAEWRAFTLIELLVVVAIIALLMSILLPSLRAAREQARAVVCGQRMRDLGVGMATYFAEHEDWIPGINTTGVAVRAKMETAGLHNARLPVQSWDWMTPCIARSTAMPELRAKRFKELLNIFNCPSQQHYKATIWGSSSDRPDFEAEGDWTAVSFLMPVHFQYWGTKYQGQVLGQHEVNSADWIPVKTTPDFFEAIHPTYKSVLQQVGAPARKIAAADGTRYVNTQTIDFDIHPDPNYFGAFAGCGAWWCGSHEYGVKTDSLNWSGRSVSADGKPVGQGRNLELSYRHGLMRGAGLSGTAQDDKGLINALFFDGSVRRLDDRQSRDPVYWYPKGTVVTKAGEGMIDVLNNGDKIP
jgi:prepilin-type N-terminal cleavage/methylation domain-containing protein/prepilin-type processing-associated H-X9-DG protein